MKAITTKYQSNRWGPRIIASDSDNNRVAFSTTNMTADNDQDYHEKGAYAQCEKMSSTGKLIGVGIKGGMVWVFVL